MFNTIFYTTYDPTQVFDSDQDFDKVIKQERLNSIGVYTHTAIELIFNVVILSYLISQSRSQGERAVKSDHGENIVESTWNQMGEAFNSDLHQ